MSVEMSPRQFRRWRKSLGFSQKGAAKALGLKTRIVQYYEKGERDGKKVEVPLSVRLACWSLQNGVGDFDGSMPLPLKREPDGKKAAKPDGGDDDNDDELSAEAGADLANS
jgi:transcriptional regulator with XRE-family HTH domain